MRSFSAHTKTVCAERLYRDLLVGNGDGRCRRKRRFTRHRIEVADLADSKERLVFELYST